MIPNRNEALGLLKEYNSEDHLLKHAYSVEAAMKRFAREFGEDEVYWGTVGLLHDLDYEKWPDEHCLKTRDLMREHGIDESFIHSVMSHGYGICTDVYPDHRMEKVLYTIDELTGLITAAALMRPSRSVMDLEVKSLKKKFKDKRFAAKVDRDLITKGADMLGMELDRVMELTIEGMREASDLIGL